MKTRVLLVDDDPELLGVAKEIMHHNQPELEIVTSDTTSDALKKIGQTEFDIVISDYMMPDLTGLDLLEVLRNEGDRIGFVIWTGHSKEEVAIKALNLGADYYILKGSDIKEEFNTIGEIIKKILASKAKQQRKLIEQRKASEFIHKLSHDITGIVHNIMGYATLLEEEYDKSYIERIGFLSNKLTARVKTAVSEIDTGELNEL